LKTEDILNEREQTHGDFEDVAFVHDGMMDCINHSSNILSCAKRLAISNICLKLARIACGDPNFADHWDDIAGYAMLGKGKDAVIRQEDMPSSAKAGQRFILENGKLTPIDGWGYCEKCDGSTQHEDGFCLRESCWEEEVPASTSSKMEHVSEKKGGCINNEPDYSIRHMFSCQRKFAGCDCVSFCKVKAGYKTSPTEL